jgi:hypothetical protein
MSQASREAAMRDDGGARLIATAVLRRMVIGDHFMPHPAGNAP